jgi:hypothetical protein
MHKREKDVAILHIRASTFLLAKKRQSPCLDIMLICHEERTTKQIIHKALSIEISGKKE